MSANRQVLKDRIAREAARLLETGAVGAIHQAIRHAADSLAGVDASRGVLPSVQRVRQHAQAMKMQALGDDGHAQQVRDMYIAAEQMMAMLDHIVPDCRPTLMGRAAEGHIDGGLVIHIRIYTDAPVDEIISDLDAMEIESPQVRTAETRFGRFNQIYLSDQGRDYVITRVPRSVRCEPDRDLFSGRSIRWLPLDRLRQKIATTSDQDKQST